MKNKSMENMTEAIIKELRCPDREFSPIPFWFLNAELDKSELRRQMEDFNDKGVNGVVIHPRMGIPRRLEYLSEEYFDIIVFIVETAAELDMKVVLYDEAMYPSGSAHGEVVKSNPELASVGITMADNPSDGEVIAECAGGRLIVAKKCGGTIRGIHYGEDDGEKNAPLSADILNPDAVKKFTELTHERYYKYLSKYFGNTIIGFFTDEPCVLGRGTEGFFEWTNGLEKDIAELGGDLSELEALFYGGRNKTTEIYNHLISERLNEVYYKGLSEWCQNHGVALMGHPKESGDIDEERYFHIPGQDLVFRMVSPENGGVDSPNSVQAKCTSDAARLTGRRRNSNECFGACSRNHIPWYLTADDMKWYIDWLGVRGVNMFIPHAFYYSVEGKRSQERPPDVGPNNIWWKHYRYFSDYIKRVSYIMTNSKNCAETAVLCKSGDMKPKTVKEFYQTQREFNYVPYSALDKACAKEGRLCIGDYEYNYVLGETELDVRKIKCADDVPRCDFRTDTPQRDLRVSHIVKHGVHMYFIVNEGEKDINTKAELAAEGTPAAMNLWSGEYWGIPWERGGFGARIELSLKRRESILILFDKTGKCYAPAKKKTRIDGLCFRQISEDRMTLTKTYAAEYEKIDGAENEYFEVSCEEMAECYVNGEFAGVSFFNHGFDIGKLLAGGKNEIKLVITGSIANKYSDEDIYYGLM